MPTNSGGPDMMQAWTVLITGFAVVFAILILLIVIIQIYGSIVYNVQNKPKKDKTKKKDDDAPKGGTPAVVQSAPASTASNGISNEILAVIAAAVEAMYGTKQVRIKNIKKSNSRSAWGSAGVKANTRPF